MIYSTLLKKTNEEASNEENFILPHTVSIDISVVCNTLDEGVKIRFLSMVSYTEFFIPTTFVGGEMFCVQAKKKGKTVGDDLSIIKVFISNLNMGDEPLHLWTWKRDIIDENLKKIQEFLSLIIAYYEDFIIKGNFPQLKEITFLTYGEVMKYVSPHKKVKILPCIKMEKNNYK